MSLRPLMALVVLAVQLCACSTDRDKKAAIEQMERKHAVWAETMGGGGM